MHTRAPGPVGSHPEDLDRGTLARTRTQAPRTVGLHLPLESFRAPPDATFVSLLCLPPARLVAPGSAPGGDVGGAFGAFIRMARDLDARLKGSARQSWGTIIYGEGDGRGGAATKAAPGAKLRGSFDYAAFMELMGVVLDAVPEGTTHHALLESMRDELDAKHAETVAGFVTKVISEEEDLRKALGLEASGKTASAVKPGAPKATSAAPKPAARAATPAAPPAKSLVDILYAGHMTQQWVWGDPSVPPGQVSIFTDAKGVRREVRSWIDKKGTIRYELLRVLPD